FHRTYVRGDTDFSQTKHLDRWDASGDVRFLFGIDANDTLKALADELPAELWFIRKERARVEKSGHADSTWSCVNSLPTGSSACPSVFCTTPLASGAIGTSVPTIRMAK